MSDSDDEIARRTSLVNEMRAKASVLGGNLPALGEGTFQRWCSLDAYGEPMHSTATPPQYGPRPDLAKRISDRVGTPWSVKLTRCGDGSTLLAAHCESCSRLLILAVNPQEAAEQRVDRIEHRSLDCRCVDGLTPEQCLERFTAMQRAEGSGPPMLTALLNPLTDSQRELARSEWSAALKAKQQEARGKERAAIVVDDDRWEP